MHVDGSSLRVTLRLPSDQTQTPEQLYANATETPLKRSIPEFQHDGSTPVDHPNPIVSSSARRSIKNTERGSSGYIDAANRQVFTPP
jgi:hypothetical protein